jgi:oligopeptide transport system ATP-binding protein
MAHKPKTKFRQELVDNDVVLSVRHLKQYFKVGFQARKFITKAVHDISFDIKRGEVFGLVGESGCGKTTTGRSIIRLYDITSGSVYFQGYRINAGSRWNEKEIKWKRIRAKRKIAELRQLEKDELAEERSDAQEINDQVLDAIRAKYAKQIQDIRDEVNEIVRVQKQKIREIKYDNKHVDPRLMSKIQMIFQDPVDSLDPRMTVEDIIQEGLHIQGFKNKADNSKKVVEVLERVGLIAEYASRYPHEFSGGQRQRIGIARAIIMNPELLICDEPISALDVSIRAQIINLLNDLKEQYQLTMLFIAHDLSVVKYFCDRIAVMYYGEIVEMASSDDLFKHPLHPYTKALLSAIPKPDPLSEK